MTTPREDVIRQIYRLRRENYRDVSGYKTKQAIMKRLAFLKQSIEARDEEARVHTNRAYKRDWLEQCLLLTKAYIYGFLKPTVSLGLGLLESQIVRWELELSERQWWEKEESHEARLARKENHTVALLVVHMRTNSDEELRALLTRLQG